MYDIIPIKTPILTHHDDITDAIVKYGGDKITANDVVCVAESVVAITQGSAVRCDDLHPTLLAKFLSRLFPAKGSISSPYSMQCLINYSGGLRVFFAVILGTLAKCLGIAGVFYRTAGYQARLIDDVTGTMPPFDKHIVPGPFDPVGVSEKIKTATGAFGACIADVNDLKRSHILGTSAGVDAALVAQILIDNPFGNDSQKTPICIIKNYMQGIRNQESGIRNQKSEIRNQDSGFRIQNLEFRGRPLYANLPTIITGTSFHNYALRISHSALYFPLNPIS